MSRELLSSQKNNSGILLDPRTKLAVLITIAVFILGGSYEGIMQYYIIVLAAIPLLLLSAVRKWKGAVLYILIFGGSLCLEMFGLSRLSGVANYIAVAIVGILLRFTHKHVGNVYRGFGIDRRIECVSACLRLYMEPDGNAMNHSAATPSSGL